MKTQLRATTILIAAWALFLGGGQSAAAATINPDIYSGSSEMAGGAGLDSFEVQFFQDFGGASGVDSSLPPRVTYSDTGIVPEPASLLLLGTGLAVGGRIFRKKRSRP